MKSKLLASLLALSMISNLAMPIAHADDSTGSIFEVSEISQADAETALNTRSEQLQALSDSEIQSRLGSAADQIENFAADPAHQLSAEKLGTLKALAQRLREKAADPKTKKKMLRGLKHAGQTALMGIAMAGSTVRQLVIMPLYAIGGLVDGLVSAKIERNGEGVQHINNNAYSLTVMTEIVLTGPAALTAFLVLFAAVGADNLGEMACKSKDITDQYTLKLCKLFTAYDNDLLDKGANLGTSAIGYGINRGVRFAAIEVAKGAVIVFKGGVSLAKRILKKRSHTGSTAQTLTVSQDETNLDQEESL
jgi:hypothetical protein